MSDIVAALGPGKKLDSLSSLAPDYVTVRRAFDNLLVFPHLEAIGIEDASKPNLLSLVMDGNSRFSELSNIDIGLARKVISYDTAFFTIVDALNIDLLVKTLQPVAQEYANHARAHSEVNLKFFADFTDYIASVDRRIGSLDAVLTQLDAQIQAKSEALANKNIITTLWEVLKTLYKLASTAEDSDVQIAAILGVTITTIAGSFESLFDDRLRLQKIISSLKGLHTRTQDLKIRFVALSAGLKTVSISSRSLLDSWDDVAARMGTVAGDVDSVSAPQTQQLKKLWAKVASNAKDYINVLLRSASDDTASASAVESHRVITAKFNAFPKVPITADEIRLHKLAAVHGHNAQSAPGFSSRSESEPRISVAASDEEVIETVLGPPAETEASLKDLADSTGKVIKQFNDLLQHPYLDQYKCKSPVDGSDSDLATVMNYYRRQYIQLQLDTLPVARDLSAYADLQNSLLPIVFPDAQATDTDMPMSLFLDMNVPLVKEYLEDANKLSKRSTAVKNDWDNVINLVKKSINECDQNISTLSKSMADLSDQQRNASFYAFMAVLGVFVAFTAAVFLPGVGMLIALGIGGALGGLAVWQIILDAKLTIAINDLGAAIDNAQTAKTRLQNLLPYVTNVETSLSTISGIWSKIATVLTTVALFFKVLNGKNGYKYLEFYKPIIMKKWVAVEDAVNTYINAVS